MSYLKKIVSLSICALFLSLNTNTILVNAQSTSSNSSATDIASDKMNGYKEIEDSLGRKVRIPKNITKVAPSGSMASMLIYSVNPELLAGWGNYPNESARKYFSEKYLKLPEFGAFYGKKSNINLETLISAKPQVIIDIGEKKKNMEEDLESLSKQTGLPVVFIEFKLQELDKTLSLLSEIVGNEEQCIIMSDYAKQLIVDSEGRSKLIAEDKKLSVYYGTGKDGLQTNYSDSMQSENILLAGAKNVVPSSNKEGSSMVTYSMEELIKLNPDVILIDYGFNYETILKDELWAELKAVKDNRVFEVPDGPYNWMGRPPVVNKILGVRWLGNLLYPEAFNIDLRSEAKKFYKIFYHYELNDSELDELLKNSTLKNIKN